MMNELDVVVLQHIIVHEGIVLPKGSKGTIVHIFHDQVHYLIEFTEPAPCVVMVDRDDIQIDT
jgi:hypothetical protein